MRHRLLVLAFALSSLVTSPMANAGQAIVGSWLLDSGNAFGVTAFLADGRYIEASVFTGDSAHTGIEWGTYGWNAASGQISAVSAGDTNGNWGFAGDVDGPQYITVAGSVGSLFQPGCSSCSATLNRLTAGSSPIVGSWLLDIGPALGVATFLEDGRYIWASAFGGDSEHTGIEWGTYSWNATTGQIAAVSAGDTNGDWGFAGDVHGDQHITVVGNTGNLFQPGCPAEDPCEGTLQRILPVPEPASYTLMLAGLAFMGGMARRRKQAKT